MAREEVVHDDAAEGEPQLFEVGAGEGVNGSMKEHQEYNVWVQNFAPSILSMVLEQLDVYKNVGAARDCHARPCTITTKWRSSCSRS